MDNNGHGHDSANHRHQQHQHGLVVDWNVDDPAVPLPQDRFIDDDGSDNDDDDNNHNDDDSREEGEEDNADDDEAMGDELNDSDSDATDDSNDDTQRVVESVVIPTPEEVELTYTYPNDFMNDDGEELHWSAVVERGQFFRLILDPSCTRIPDRKFNYCRFLIEIIIPKESRLKMIGKSSLGRCHNLQRIKNGLPAGLITIDDHAFDCCVSLQGITIPSTVILVGVRCFGNCSNLTIVTFESSSANPYVEIRDYAFAWCEKLWSVTLPQNLKFIPNYCFHHCTLLTNITISLYLEEIGEGAFMGCCSLRFLYLLSKHIARIQKSAFCRCTSLEKVVIRSLSSNIQIDPYIFLYCPVLSTIQVLPSLWPALFESMIHNHPDVYEHNQDPSFCYKFLHQYHYQMERLIEWNNNNTHITLPISAVASSSLALPDDTTDREDGEKHDDDDDGGGKRRR